MNLLVAKNKQTEHKQTNKINRTQSNREMDKTMSGKGLAKRWQCSTVCSSRAGIPKFPFRLKCIAHLNISIVCIYCLYLWNCHFPRLHRYTATKCDHTKQSLIFQLIFVRCPVPVTINNGEFYYQESPECSMTSGFDSTCYLRILCDQGYRLNGDMFMYCEYTGNAYRWTQQPTCERKLKKNQTTTTTTKQQTNKTKQQTNNKK